MPCVDTLYDYRNIDISDRLPRFEVGMRCWHAHYDFEVVIVKGTPDRDGDYWVAQPSNMSWVFAIPYYALLDIDKKRLAD